MISELQVEKLIDLIENYGIAISNSVMAEDLPGSYDVEREYKEVLAKAKSELEEFISSLSNSGIKWTLQ